MDLVDNSDFLFIDLRDKTELLKSGKIPGAISCPRGMLEFFIDDKDNLLVNEIAPRVHNSGHMTINSHNISQFENHVRAVCGLKKVKTLKLYNAKMTNILGNEITKYKGKKFQDNEFFFDYLKKEIKEKRKMGHFTEINKIND